MKVRVLRTPYLNSPPFLWLCQSARYGSPLLQDSFVYNRYFQAHNEEEEVVSALVVEGPDRDLRQPRSSGGKLAYVIFGDQSTGVYYNWYDFPFVEYTFKLIYFKEFL